MSVGLLERPGPDALPRPETWAEWLTDRAARLEDFLRRRSEELFVGDQFVALWLPARPGITFHYKSRATLDRFKEAPAPRAVIAAHRQQYGLTEAAAQLHWRELMRYFALGTVFSFPFGMTSEVIDHIWHELVERDNHGAWARQVSRVGIGHQPSGSGDPDLNTDGLFRLAYRLTFKEEAPHHLWPRDGASSCFFCPSPDEPAPPRRPIEPAPWPSQSAGEALCGRVSRGLTNDWWRHVPPLSATA
ncbi:MAG TPA: hypothetical protein VMT30_03650 [Candidatus Saccharimonadia bacterium]|nr:hypothetical protein [Candidatus Saccharimonadia bacterium]